MSTTNGTAAPEAEAAAPDVHPTHNGLSSQLLSPVADRVTCSESKVTVVGVGQVGMACAFSLLSQVSGLPAPPLPSPTPPSLLFKG